MEGQRGINVVVRDSTNTVVFTSMLYSPSTTVEEVLVAVCKAVRVDPTKFCLHDLKQKVAYLMHSPLYSYFGHVGPGGTIELLFSVQYEGIRFAPPPQPVQGQAVAPVAGQGQANKDLATAAAKKIYEASKIGEEVLVPLLCACSESTLQELSQLRIPKGKRKKGEKKDDGSMDFMKFYQDIVKDMEEQLLEHQDSAICEVSVFVQRDLTLRQFLKGRAETLELLCEYVRGAENAVGGARKLSIINYITLGRRLEEAKAYWERNKKSFEMKQRSIVTWEQYLHYIGEKYQRDYVKKIRTVSVLADEYPNFALVSCCGIAELTLYAKRLLEYLDKFVDEAIRWRRDANQSFKWTRRTIFTMGDETYDKMQCLSMEEVGVDETYEAWNGHREGVTRKHIEELQAEEENAAEAKQAQSTATQNAKDKIDKINDEK